MSVVFLPVCNQVCLKANLQKKISLKGVFAKDERGYRLTSKNIRWWLLLIWFLYFMIRGLFLKTWKYSFLFPGFLIMKTTFSYFPVMFENPVPAVKSSCKRNINDLFGTKLIFYRSESNIATFWICMDTIFFGMSRF